MKPDTRTRLFLVGIFLAYVAGMFALAELCRREGVYVRCVWQQPDGTYKECSK